MYYELQQCRKTEIYNKRRFFVISTYTSHPDLQKVTVKLYLSLISTTPWRRIEDTGWRRVIRFTPLVALPTGKQHSVPIAYEGGWAPQPVGRLARNLIAIQTELSRFQHSAEQVRKPASILIMQFYWVHGTKGRFSHCVKKCVSLLRSYSLLHKGYS
jgi:hypothetical protein